jgi:hypothetical protein
MPQVRSLMLDTVPYTRIYPISDLAGLHADLTAHLAPLGWSEPVQFRRTNETPLRANPDVFADGTREKVDQLYADDFAQWGDLWSFNKIACEPAWPEDAVREVQLRAEFGKRLGDMRQLALQQQRRASSADEQTKKLSRERDALAKKLARADAARSSADGAQSSPAGRLDLPGMAAPAEQTTIRGIGDIPGWFPWMDQQVFAHFLDAQSDTPYASLVELGVYKGKSAALVGRYRRAGETFTVCDLFGDDTDTETANQRENSRHYNGLTRREFEGNYLALHAELPVIVQDVSSAITEYVKPETARFVHVDASHLYAHVAIDIDSAHEMLRDDGIVVFDDYRSVHTPGVSAAVWEAVFTKGLAPICVTSQKLYGTFGDPAPHRERLEAWLRSNDKFRWEAQQIADYSVVRVFYPRQRSAASVSAAPAPSTPSPTAAEAEIQKGVKQLTSEVNRLSRLVESALAQRPGKQARRAFKRARRVAGRAKRTVRARQARR